jgi:hypothetical protein
MKTKRKNIKKTKLAVWLKCGEIEKYLKSKKRVVNTTFYSPRTVFNFACDKDLYIVNCKFIVDDVRLITVSFVSVYLNCVFKGNKSNLLTHPYINDRNKFKKKSLK